MTTVFDVYAIVLLLASLTIFIVRYVQEEPPVMPYLVIACTCAVGNWLADAGARIGGLTLMIAASFLFLSCLLYPKIRSMGGKKDSDASSRP